MFLLQPSEIFLKYSMRFSPTFTHRLYQMEFTKE